MSQKKVIAVDGESASGKGTLAKKLAEKINYGYLDTGLLYRLVGYLAYKDNLINLHNESFSINTEQLIVNIAKKTSITDINKYIDELKSDEAATLASMVGKIQDVRTALLHFQKDFGNNPVLINGNQADGSVIDGRDIGTVIFPNSFLKFYVTANLNVRANRRFKELQAKGQYISENALRESLSKRDFNDKNRSSGALIKAKDAVEIDTSNMDIETMLSVAYEHYKKIN